jgi:hypothetical protein
MPGQCRLESQLAVFAQARQRPALVPPHQARITDHVCGDNRRQSALFSGQWNYPSLLQASGKGTWPAKQ